MNPVFELAKKYYPRLWEEVRINALVAAGKLTETEAAEVIQREMEEAHDNA